MYSSSSSSIVVMYKYQPGASTWLSVTFKDFYKFPTLFKYVHIFVLSRMYKAISPQSPSAHRKEISYHEQNFFYVSDVALRYIHIIYVCTLYRILLVYKYIEMYIYIHIYIRVTQI